MPKVIKSRTQKDVEQRFIAIDVDCESVVIATGSREHVLAAINKWCDETGIEEDEVEERISVFIISEEVLLETETRPGYRVSF